MSDAATPLPTTLAECHAMITELAAINATLRETTDEQQTLLQALQRDLALMKRTLFGQRRERFEDPRQAMLFDSVVVGELEPEGVSNQDDNVSNPMPRTTMKTTRKARHLRIVLGEFDA